MEELLSFIAVAEKANVSKQVLIQRMGSLIEEGLEEMLHMPKGPTSLRSDDDSAAMEYCLAATLLRGLVECLSETSEEEAYK